jgi:hypothetical protein
MKQIKFFKDWNGKLGNKIFSTIRKKHDVPEDYYGAKVGQIFDLFLQDRKLGKARLLSAQIYHFADIPAEIMLLDTGTNTYQDAIGVFYGFYKTIQPTDKFYLLLFERLNGKEIEGKPPGATPQPAGAPA